MNVELDDRMSGFSRTGLVRLKADTTPVNLVNPELREPVEPVNLRSCIQSAQFYWRTNLAVTLGVAAAVAVLAGALVVGDSVRGSLRDIALGRLGRTDQVLSSMGFFREALSDDAKNALGADRRRPTHRRRCVRHARDRRAGARRSVLVYGVDERFWKFHGLPPPDGVDGLAGARDGGRRGSGRRLLVTRLQKPSEVPIESLFGRKDDVGRTVRLTLAGVLPRDRLGEFALRPQQTGGARGVRAASPSAA